MMEDVKRNYADNIELGDKLLELKKLSEQYKEAQFIVKNIGEYYGYAYSWDYKADLELDFKLGIYYIPNFSNESKFDSKLSSETLNIEMKRLILTNIKATARQALLNIEAKVKNAEEEFTSMLSNK